MELGLDGESVQELEHLFQHHDTQSHLDKGTNAVYQDYSEEKNKYIGSFSFILQQAFT